MISLFLGGVTFGRFFSIEIIKKSDDIFSQVERVTTSMNLFQSQLKEIQDQLNLLKKFTQISSELETKFNSLDGVVKTLDKKIDDIRKDVYNHDDLIKDHENIKGAKFQSRG